jgi:serine/threonine protein kinase/tetratricopeptide (TPR) repeat protein
MPAPDEPTLPTVAGGSGAAEAPAARVRGSSVGRYLLLDELGHGGMGVVYKAYDPELDRPIALKLLQAGEGSEGASHGHRERLLREAQALARLQHPNVIAIHDVGTVDDSVFIAMEYVEGQTVRAWLKSRPRARHEILDVFLAAGEGLAAAHRAGLVHRDFKPDNVMVGNDGRVRVLDFGLARSARAGATDEPVIIGVSANAAEGGLERVPEQAPQSGAQLGSSQGSKANLEQTAASKGKSKRGSLISSASSSQSHPSASASARLLSSPITRVGDTVGTPRFMAPEQHLAEATDESADQYSFCVSLYWALYDAFPFAGKAFDEMLANLLAGRISDAPAGSTVPRWLRQVLVRGLAVKPRDRFPSMGDLLGALRADPRLTRLRWLRAALVALSAAAVLAAAVAGGLAYKVHRNVLEQARLAQQFGQEVERIAALSRYSALLPLHDTRREMDAVRARMQKLKARMQTLGAIAAGPGLEALGRGELALERYEDALRELEASWKTGYRSPELAYALGAVHGKLYQRALADLQKTGDEKKDAAQREALARAHRDPALRYLREVGAHEGGVDAPEYVEGLIALYEQRFDDALALARKTADRVLWLYEARTLEGDIQLMAGKERYLRGDVDGALARFDQGGQAYRQAADVARSGTAAYLGRCRLLAETALIQVNRSQAPEATVKEAIDACSAAATTRPDEAEPLALKARAVRYQAVYDEEHGRSPVASIEQAIALATRALEIEPGNVRVHQVIARAHRDLARYRLRKGEDPRPSLKLAIEHAHRVIDAASAGAQDAYSVLCDSYITHGDYEGARGIDPGTSYQAAIRSAKQALAVSPDDFSSWNALGLSELFEGLWRGRHGEDPTDAFTRAAQAFEKEVQLSPNLDYGDVNLCDLQRRWAELEAERGVDPQPRLERAIASCERAIALDGNYAGSRANLGDSYLVLAEWRLEHAGDPSEPIEKSRAHLERAITMDAADGATLGSLALLRLLEARWLSSRGRDPSLAFAAAETFLRRALAAGDGRSANAQGIWAELCWRRAELGKGSAADRAAQVREGLSHVARALEEEPGGALSSAIEGALHLVAARSAPASAERVAEAERARASLDKALAIDGNLELKWGPLKAEASRLAVK